MVFLQKHASEEHVYPTVQVTARPLVAGEPDNTRARELLEMSIDSLEQQWDDVEVLTATTDRIIGGYRANSIVAEYTLYTERDDEIRAFDIRSRSHTIFTPAVAFTVGMSSSIDEEVFEESDFEQIVSSISIG